MPLPAVRGRDLLLTLFGVGHRAMAGAGPVASPLPDLGSPVSGAIPARRWRPPDAAAVARLGYVAACELARSHGAGRRYPGLDLDAVLLTADGQVKLDGGLGAPASVPTESAADVRALAGLLGHLLARLPGTGDTALRAILACPGDDAAAFATALAGWQREQRVHRRPGRRRLSRPLAAAAVVVVAAGLVAIPARDAGPGYPAGAGAWLPVVQGLARARAALFTAAPSSGRAVARGLAAVDAPASPAWAADRGLLEWLQHGVLAQRGGGLHPAGLSYPVEAVAAAHRSERGVTINVEIGATAYRLLNPTGSVVAVEMAQPPHWVRLVLSQTAAGWRVERVAGPG